MSEQVYDKLVRDKIPEIIKNNNEIPIYRELSDDEFLDYLLEKDSEELEELRNAPSYAEARKELADKLEIIIAIAKYYGFSLDTIIKEAEVKREKNGGFEKRLLLEKVITKEEK